jgi:hypothetical protein
MLLIDKFKPSEMYQSKIIFIMKNPVVKFISLSFKALLEQSQWDIFCLFKLNLLFALLILEYLYLGHNKILKLLLAFG